MDITITGVVIVFSISMVIGLIVTLIQHAIYTRKEKRGKK